MDSVDFRILGDLIAVEPHDAEDKTPGGIVLPDEAKEQPKCGTVLAIGPGHLLESGERTRVWLDVGDEVYYDGYAGRFLEIHGKKIRVMREGEILAVSTKRGD